MINKTVACVQNTFSDYNCSIPSKRAEGNAPRKRNNYDAEVRQVSLNVNRCLLDRLDPSVGLHWSISPPYGREHLFPYNFLFLVVLGGEERWKNQQTLQIENGPRARVGVGVQNVLWKSNLPMLVEVLNIYSLFIKICRMNFFLTWKLFLCATAGIVLRLEDYDSMSYKLKKEENVLTSHWLYKNYNTNTGQYDAWQFWH